ncbi:Oxysterol-binding protein-related protein 9 [Chelonia mydas]|uniref:Oxysterol-binding protein-related protein 9 n=1 Tax=Chelonia mydas TaxID=8469 RepID=M7BD92_CHEMY|nr:Oxysterol-binding protein-related protein 9 [Chelonia mydas]
MASIMEGPLSKWTNVMKGWQYRWFVLDYNAGLLSYYTGAVIGIDDEDDSTFTITVDQKTFHFQGALRDGKSDYCLPTPQFLSWLPAVTVWKGPIESGFQPEPGSLYSNETALQLKPHEPKSAGTGFFAL